MSEFSTGAGEQETKPRNKVVEFWDSFRSKLKGGEAPGQGEALAIDQLTKKGVTIPEIKPGLDETELTEQVALFLTRNQLRFATMQYLGDTTGTPAMRLDLNQWVLPRIQFTISREFCGIDLLVSSRLC